MFLKVRIRNNDFECVMNEGYRHIKQEFMECYIMGKPLAKDYKMVDDSCIMEAIHSDITTVSKYNGRFSGILIDHKKKNIILFADRTGGGYLYYTVWKKNLFVSDKMFTIAEQGFPLEENKYVIAMRLVYGYCLGNETYFKNIYILRAGRAAKVTLDGNIKEVISDTVYKQGIVQDEPIEVIAKKVTDKLEKAVVNILKNSSDKVVATITGGLDSRLLVGLASKNGFYPPCFCVDSDNGYDEIRLARNITDLLGLDFNYYYLEHDYYSECMDSCYLQSEYTCVMHVWFAPFKNIEDINEKTVLMGIGGGELLRINNGAARAQAIASKGNETIKKSILTNTITASRYMNESYRIELEKLAKVAIEKKIDEYLVSERGLRDYYLDARFYDAVDAIFAMYPKLSGGVSPYLDTEVLDLLYTLPCTEEYVGDNFYRLIYQNVAEGLLMTDSTRTPDIPKEYVRPKYVCTYDSMSKIFDTLLKADDLIDVSYTKKIYDDKLRMKDYSFGEGERWLYSYIRMREYISEMGYAKAKDGLIHKILKKLEI